MALGVEVLSRALLGRAHAGPSGRTAPLQTTLATQQRERQASSGSLANPAELERGRLQHGKQQATAQMSHACPRDRPTLLSCSCHVPYHNCHEDAEQRHQDCDDVRSVVGRG
eukprot:scaffold8_cov249-Pinguiococcus_pyrenoidosus.AAC.20